MMQVDPTTMSEELPPLPAEWSSMGVLRMVTAAEAQAYARTAVDTAIAKEREECAALCEARYMGDNNREDMEARRCADAIRARK